MAEFEHRAYPISSLVYPTLATAVYTVRCHPYFVYYFESKVGRGLILKYLVCLDYMPPQMKRRGKSQDDLAVAAQGNSNKIR